MSPFPVTVLEISRAATFTRAAGRDTRQRRSRARPVGPCVWRSRALHARRGQVRVLVVCCVLSLLMSACQRCQADKPVPSEATKAAAQADPATHAPANALADREACFSAVADGAPATQAVFEGL